MTRAILPTAVLLSALSLGAGGPQTPAGTASAEQEKAPGFRVESDSIDLGTVMAGTDAVATFVFHNDSARDVRILRAAPS